MNTKSIKSFAGSLSMAKAASRLVPQVEKISRELYKNEKELIEAFMEDDKFPALAMNFYDRLTPDVKAAITSDHFYELMKEHRSKKMDKLKKKMKQLERKAS